MIILRLAILCSLLLAMGSLYAQFHDNHWMLSHLSGQASSSNDSFGVSILSFYNADLNIVNNQEIDLDFDGAGNSFSDYEGNLLLYTDSQALGQLPNDTLENGVFAETDNESSATFPQANLFLPFCRADNSFQYIRANNRGGIGIGTHTNKITRSILQLNEQTDELSIDLKNELVLEDTLNIGQLTATRHANGRDWWIVVSTFNGNKLYSILITPEGIGEINEYYFPEPVLNGGGQSVFSPDGSKFIQFYANGGFGDDATIDIFDFDRCTGLISNQNQGIVGEGRQSAGVAVSPSSRYLYVSHWDRLYKYDLWADDILATQDTIGRLDDYREWGIVPATFFQAQLAIDGKIYLNTSTVTKVLHVIHDPDQPDTLCRFEQHAIPLPNYNDDALANHPNYRLGPIDGSPCDTLGIDNLPRAYYRADRDTSETLSFSFHDLSYYEPANWYWTFGDGGTSTERHPDHEYAMPGIYEVCLTVSNGNGSDTHCRTYNLGVTSTDGRHFGSDFHLKLFPNPATDIFYVDIIDYVPLDAYLILYDALGRPVHQQRLWQRQTAVQVGALPAGVYAYEVREQGQRVGQGKVVLR